jgi:Ca2+-binding EF-hand superfamily protein
MRARSLFPASAVILALIGASADPARAGDDSRPPPALDAAAAGRADREAVQDVIFLGETRPVFLRLRLSAGDRGFRAAWLDFVRALHADLDRDGSKTVTADEVDRGSFQALVRAMTGGASASARAELDEDPKDGVISVDELADALRPALGPFGVKVGHVATQRTDALFGQLDRDQDGSVTPAELKASVATLPRLDLDEDEQIDLNELEPFSNPLSAQSEDDPMRRGRYAAVPTVVELSTDDPSFRPVRLLLKKYDRGTREGAGAGDNLLSRAEFGIDARLFAAADTDGDAALDTEELRRFLARVGPDLELRARLSADGPGSGPGTAAIDAVGPEGRPLPAAFKVQRLTASDLEIAFDEIHLEFHVEDGDRTINEAKQFLKGQFQAADTDANGYLEKSEVTKGHGALAGLFDLIDRDADGKLYPKELDAFIDRQAVAARSRMMLTTADQGRSIFAILDLNRDRRLGTREVRGASPRVLSWDRNGDGRIGPDEIPHHYQFTIGRGELALPGVPYSQAPLVAPAAGPEQAGPSWFRKMDHNRDGDISRREFFGPAEAFRRLDRDGDGLIDADEAARAK